MKKYDRKLQIMLTIILMLLLSTAPVLAAFTFFDPMNPASVPQTLSQSGIYTGTTITAEAIPYDVNTPLWKDGAIIKRYLLKGPGAQITFNDTSDYYGYSGDFVFVKSMILEVVNGEAASQRYLETSLLVYKPDTGKWFVFNYHWNKEQTDATLMSDWDIIDSVYTVWPQGAGGPASIQKWEPEMPAVCASACHRQDGRQVMGFFTAQLNRPSLQNSTINQIQHFFNIGLFAGTAPADLTALPKWEPVSNTAASLEVRARSYIAANCSMCHGASYMEASVEFQLDYHAMKAPEHDFIGFTTAFVIPDCDGRKVVAPGHAAASTLYYRQTKREYAADNFLPHVDQMPPSNTFKVDSAGLDLLEEWICSLDPAKCAVPAGQIAAGDSLPKCADVVDIAEPVSQKTVVSPELRGRLLILPEVFITAAEPAVSLYNIRGQQFYPKKLGTAMYKVDAVLPQGIYILKINDEKFVRYIR
ncbi:MAG: T9SS type A sorting domain-containing protein [Fibrobacteria bacterium]|nr:T9SS type A sorting domain-containing protein [Fibrobacteria bacterium]